MGERAPWDPPEETKRERAPWDPPEEVKTEAAKPPVSAGEHLAAAITDIPGEIYDAAKAGMRSLGASFNPWSEQFQERRRAEQEANKQGFLPGLKETVKSNLGMGSSLAAIPEMLGAPITGTGRSVIGHGLSALPGNETYEQNKEKADLAMMGLAARRGPTMPAGQPRAPTPQPPTTGPFGVTLSEGQATGDLNALAREQANIRSPGAEATPAQQARHARAREFVDQQQQQLRNAQEGVSRALDPNLQEVAQTPQQAAGIAQQGIQGRARTAKAGVDTAYEAAKAHPGEFHPTAFDEFGPRIQSRLTFGDEPVFVDNNTPNASRMLQDIDNNVLNARQRLTGVNLQDIDQWRKRLVTLRRDAYASGNASDARAAQRIIQEYDNRIDEAVRGGQFSGTPEALRAWEAARAAHGEYRSTFRSQGQRDAVGREIEKIIGVRGNAPLTPNDVADVLWSAGGVNPSTRHVQTAMRVRDILGENSPEWSAVRQGLFRRIIDSGDAEKPFGPGQIVTRLHKFLNKDGREMADAMYPAERGLLQAYLDFNRRLEVPRDIPNYPNTAPAVVRALEAVTRKIGVGIGGAIGAYLGHKVGLPYAAEIGAGVGAKTSQWLGKATDAARMRQLQRQMPLLAEQARQYQIAVARANRINSPPNIVAATIAGTNLARSLKDVPFYYDDAPYLYQHPAHPARAHGGPVWWQRAKARQHGGEVEEEAADNRDIGLPTIPPPIVPPRPARKGAATFMVEGYAPHFIQGLGDWVATPGRAAREGLTPEDEAGWGAGTALGMIGAGTFSGRGTLGAAGVRPPKAVKIPKEEIGYGRETPAPEPVAEPPRAGAEGQRGAGSRDSGLEEAQRRYEEARGVREPLADLPQKPLTLAGESYIPGPVGFLHDVAENYAKTSGIPYKPAKTYQPVNERRAREIASAFDEMKHAPEDPVVRASYDALINETIAQYKALENAGVKFEFIRPDMPDPYYESPRLAQKDFAENKHLWVYPTSSGFGTGPEAAAAMRNNPMLQPTDIVLDGRRLLANDVFRIVHDVFGHFKEGNGFRAAGEENAWRSHSAMYSDQARPAMTSETRGQNSWVNYGPHGEKNRTAKADQTVYADQKIGLLPDWVVNEGAADPLPVKDPKLRAKAEAIRGKWERLAERYPEVGEPILRKKEGKFSTGLGEVVPYKTLKEAEEKIAAGKAYWAKGWSQEATEFAKDRDIIRKDMEVNGYTPYFDPAKRADVDPRLYPTSLDTTRDVIPAKPETLAKYNKLYDTPEARARLKKGFKEGQKIPESDRWYFMQQLEREYIRHLGDTAGRQAFKHDFADAMAATTGGADPTTNWLMAHYAGYLAKRGLPMPEHGYETPYPIGGRFAGRNLQQYGKFQEEGSWGAGNPKRHDFSAAFTGHPAAVIDEQMSGAIVPGMQQPEWYTPATQVVGRAAAKAGVNPRGFQDVTWAGLKKMSHDMEQMRKYPDNPEKRIPFKYEGPMISHINASIERTHRLTGLSRHEVVKRMLTHDIPMYGIGAGMLAPALMPDEQRAQGGAVRASKVRARRQEGGSVTDPDPWVGALPTEAAGRGLATYGEHMLEGIRELERPLPGHGLEEYEIERRIPATTGIAAGMVGTPRIGVPEGAVGSGISKPIRAYHGSPYDFDKFSLEHIGKGEGAQAYGHGLYFAENPAVAADYKGRLSTRALVGGDADANTALTYLAKAKFDKSAARDLLEQNLNTKLPDNHPLVKAINDYTPGRMYEVNIHAQPEQFLDWDKPLHTQDRVVDILREQMGLKDKPLNQTHRLFSDRGVELSRPGGAAYQQLSRALVGNAPTVSNTFREAGIPGIKYLDQGSRFRPDTQMLAGFGEKPSDVTHNYVLFRDDIIDILRKYGIAGLTALPGVAEYLAQQQGQQQRAAGGRVNAQVDRSFDVPFLAGASNDGKRMYIDRRLPSKLKVGDKVIDPAKYLLIHEMTERKAMKRGMPYLRAHHNIATPAERAAVEADGVDWKQYEHVMDGYIDETEHEKPKRPPPDLYEKPYPCRLRKKLKRLAKKEAA